MPLDDAAEAAVDSAGPKAHRALADAQRLAEVYREIVRLVAEELR